MDDNHPSLVADVRGASRLVIDLTLRVTDVVETMHHNVARRPGLLAAATFEPTRGLTGVVYRTVRGVTRLVGGSVDGAIGLVAPWARMSADWPHRDAVLGALNGVIGDRLEASGNPLAVRMQLCSGGAPMALTPASIAAVFRKPRGRVFVMVHGLCMSDRQWDRGSHDHGRSLAADFGAHALYLRYNSGLHISSNGTLLAHMLERLAEHWPVPLTELVLVGHSMGGLLIRSAHAAAEAAGHRWPGRLRALVFLGTPHHGAPMERGGHGLHLLLASSPYTAAFTRLGELRSAGITDLRHGYVLDRDWQGSDRFRHRGDRRVPLPLPATVPCFAIAGSSSKAVPRRGTARGDGLVPVASALGEHPDPRRNLHFDPARQLIAYGTGHLDLLASGIVYRRMRRWLYRSLGWGRASDSMEQRHRRAEVSSS